MRLKTATIIILHLILLTSSGRAQIDSNPDRAFRQAFAELEQMLQEPQTANFERAVFVSENAYHGNAFSMSDFQQAINAELYSIVQLMIANDQSASIDFRVIRDRSKPMDVSAWAFTENEKREMYFQALANWSIFTYMTEPTQFRGAEHQPYTYNMDDPFGMQDWRHSQVLNLIRSDEHSGNCFALTALFKIFADRLNSEAYLCTAPQHIYIQHRDPKGDFYNVELATATHPGDGSISTLTYTWMDAIVNGIALRRLDGTQNIALCMVNLGKSYEHKFGVKDADFMLECAEAALKYDPKNLNALLLKQQVLEAQVMRFAVEHEIEAIDELRSNADVAETFQELEKLIVRLNQLGYHPMPRYMQDMILAGLKGNEPVLVKDRTPEPFSTLENVDKDDKRYSTLSGGLFEEVHTQQPQEQYGRFVLDVAQKKLVKMTNETTSEAIIDPVAFAMSIDPLASKYPQWSPYAALADNPILHIDPDGREFIPLNEQSKENLNAAIYSTFGEALGNLFVNADNYKVDVKSKAFKTAIKKIDDKDVIEKAYAFAAAANSENKNFVKVEPNSEARERPGTYLVNNGGRFEFKDVADWHGAGALQWLIDGTKTVFLPKGTELGTAPASFSLYSTETPLPEPDERQRGMSEKPATTMTEGEANELIQALINADETLDETGGMRPVDAYDVNENKKSNP